MGDLAARQVTIWPVHDRKALCLKQEVVALINVRGGKGDPLAMKAAVRHARAEAAWIKTLPVDARGELTFNRNELV